MFAKSDEMEEDEEEEGVEQVRVLRTVHECGLIYVVFS